MIVDLRELAFGVPADSFLFLFLQALELLDDENFELRTNPHGKLEGDILVGIGATISSCFGLKTNGVGPGNELFDANLEPIESGLTSNCGEFAIIKIGIVHLLPYAYVFQCITITQPVGDKEVTIFGL